MFELYKNNPRKNLKFRRTDEMVQLARQLVEQYYSERGRQIRKDELRKEATQIVVAVEQAIQGIARDKVKSRIPSTRPQP